MNIKKNAYKTNRKIILWLFVQSILILSASVGFFILIEAITHKGENIITYLQRGLGMIIPMCAVLTIVNLIFSHSTFKYFSALEQGLFNIAEGSFKTRLDITKAGPLDAAYENFNKMATELEHTQILRNDFVNSFSHEFKTPITSINGFANLLLEKNVDEKEKERYLKIIADESSRLANLANSAILLSKLDSHFIMPNKKPYSLDEQLRQCSILLSAEWTKKNIDLSADLPPIKYNGNAEIMQHVWLNILSNAIKFTGDNGKIEINLTENKNDFVITISDNGIGMSQEALDRIFDKYFQADKTNNVLGLGLGLSIVYKIVKLCNGKIEINSEINHGSSFKISLPK